MNWLSILDLLAAFFIISIGILVLSNNYKNSVNRSFFVFCLFTFIWLFFYALMLNDNFGMALLFAKIGHFAVPYLPVALLHYSLRTLNIKRVNPILIIFYSYIIIVSFLVFLSPFHFTELIKYSWGLYPKGKILMIVDFIVCCLTGISVIIIFAYYYIKKRRFLDSEELNKLKYFFLSVLIFVLTTIDYLPKLPQLGIKIIPFGNIIVIIFVSLNAYAILKHHIFDINIVIRKGVIYSLLVTIIALIYFALIFLIENLFRGFIGYESAPLTIFIIALFIIIFQPLKNRIQYIVDRYFFKGSIDQIEQENIRLREELQRSEKLKTVGTLAAGMAHEIKNPLTSIKTFTEYLPKKYQDKNFIEKFQKIVGSEVDKINDIVGQLLNFAKPKPLELKNYNLENLIGETLDFLSNEFIKYKIEVIKNYSILNPVLKIDSVQIKQAILNIILNSIDAMKNKGGQLKISIEDERQQKSIKIGIEDTGCGIDKKDLPHLFDPFYSTKDANTGLGLSIVHGIIEKHHGRIEVKSELGKSTKFTIYFPKY